MNKFLTIAIVAMLAVGGASMFYPTFKDTNFFAGLEPAAGNPQGDQALREALEESLRRANEAIEKANAKLAESNTFSQEDNTLDAQ